MMDKQKPEKLSKPKSSPKAKKGPWIFMLSSIILFLVVYLLNKQKGAVAATYFYHLTLEILPVLVVVFIMMVLINLFLKTATLVKYMGKESGLKGWIVAIVAGILSIGAIYMWFPLLDDLMKKGVKPGLVAVFLYNRGIKLHWLPLMGLYFGLKYMVILTLVTILASILQGMIMDYAFAKKKS